MGETIEAFVVVPAGSTANQVARQLYSTALKDKLVESIKDVLGDALVPKVGRVKLELKKFTPLAVTSTATTTMVSSTTTEAATTTSKSTSNFQRDFLPSTTAK